MSKAVAASAPGAKVKIAIVRNGEPLELATVLDRNAQNHVAQEEEHGGAMNSLDEEIGMALGPLSADSRFQADADQASKGALVLGIKGGSVAERSGMRPGDIIVQVNRNEVADAKAAREAIGTAKKNEHAAVVLVRRGEQQFFTTIKLG